MYELKYNREISFEDRVDEVISGLECIRNSMSDINVYNYNKDYIREENEDYIKKLDSELRVIEYDILSCRVYRECILERLPLLSTNVISHIRDCINESNKKKRNCKLEISLKYMIIYDAIIRLINLLNNKKYYDDSFQNIISDCGIHLPIRIEKYNHFEMTQNGINNLIWGHVMGDCLTNDDNNLDSWGNDSSMMLCVLESLTKTKYCIDYDNIMKNFVKWYTTGEFSALGRPKKIGNTVKKAIKKYIDGYDVNQCGDISENSNGKAALVRIAGAVPHIYKQNNLSLNEKLDNVHKLSAITHAHSISKICCGLYYIIAEGIINGEKGDLVNILNQCLRRSISVYSSIKELNDYSFICKDIYWNCQKNIRPTNQISMYIVDCLNAVIWCLRNTDSYKTCIELSKEYGNIGAIVGGLAGLYYGQFGEVIKDYKNIYGENLIFDLCNASSSKNIYTPYYDYNSLNFTYSYNYAHKMHTFIVFGGNGKYTALDTDGENTHIKNNVSYRVCKYLIGCTKMQDAYYKWASRYNCNKEIYGPFYNAFDHNAYDSYEGILLKMLKELLEEGRKKEKDESYIKDLMQLYKEIQEVGY